MDFENQAAFEAYLPHPAHQPVSDRLQAAARGQDNILVMDLEL